MFGFDLHVVRADALSGVFAVVFAVMACLGTLFALHVRGAGEQAASLVYAGSAIGVTLAGDWVTLFAFWEGMALASAIVVWSGSGPAHPPDRRPGTARSRSPGTAHWPPGPGSRPCRELRSPSARR